MSIVSSYISSRAPIFRINVQTSTFMDHILAIVAGLGVRIIIDLVGYENHRLTGSLVGLWEGVIVQHFIKKSPKSLDPYIAYGVRVFIDFLFTESLIRLVLTFLFTGMGIILADIAPRVWADTGLRRFWRHFRRDLYILIHSAPSVPYFDRPRTVRFSPSQAPSIITSMPPSPSLITATTQAYKTPAPRKRPVPGSFPDYVSETDTDLSVRSPGSDYSTLTGLTRDRRPTAQTESEPSYDPDEGNRSSSVSETSTPILSEADIPSLPNIEDEDVVREVLLEDQKDEDTPRPLPINLPPTPSDTTYRVRLNADQPLEVLPPSANLPHIPDDDEDWENISRREAQTTPLFEDKSTSPLHVEPQVSSSGDQPAASIASAAEPPPMDVRLGDAQHLKTLELDACAEQPSHATVDGELATTSSKPPPGKNNEGDFDLLADFNASTTDPTAQSSDIRMPLTAQFASDSSRTLDSIWDSNPVAASSGDSWNIWGDVKDKQGGVGSNPFDISTDASNPFKRPDDTQHATAEDTRKRQDSSTATEADETTPTCTTETPTVKTPPPQQDTKASGPSVTEQKDQDPVPSISQPEATTSQPAPSMDSSLNDPTGTGPSNTQQDLDPAGEDVVTERSSSTQETSENGNSKPITAGESSETVTVTAPVIDEEPFPEKNCDRLDKALELRMEIVRNEKLLSKTRNELVWATSAASRGELSAQLKKGEENVKSLKAKAERWYSIISESSENPPTTVDLSQAEPGVFMGSAQTALTSCLLKNIRNLVIITGPTGDRKAKARKTALAARLDK
ncbi:hypothetical protein C0993_002199 [Termitomyces sp. T159_Od127]|nr:hypothetical protein C0993_002199 [Termitomyces sp. T159_Od127]